MIFASTPISGAFVIRLEKREDDRGFFARVWCKREFAENGIDVDMVQANISHNRSVGTLRGMHFSRQPSREGKLVSCGRGKIFDVIVDLRPESPTYLRHFGVQLDEASREAVYIPPGVAHGFQTLEADSDVFYMMSDFYKPDLADGVRYDDPAFGIEWPLPVSVIAERDRLYPDFDRETHTARHALHQVA